MRCEHCMTTKFGLVRQAAFYVHGWRIQKHQFCTAKCQLAFERARLLKLQTQQFNRYLCS